MQHDAVDPNITEGRFIIARLVLVGSLFATLAVTRSAPAVIGSDGREVSHEVGLSPLDYFSFGWVTPLVRRGYKSPLTPADLWQLAPFDRAKRVTAAFEEARQVHRPHCHLRSTLFRSLAYMLRRELLAQFGFAVLWSIMLFAPPFFMNRILTYVADPTSATSTMAALYVLGLFVGTLVMSGASERALFLGRRISLRIRAVLSNELYVKTLRRQGVKSTAEEEGDLADAGAITNLLNVDVSGIGEMTAYLHFMWGSPIQIIISFVFLWKLMGMAMLFGLCAVGPMLYISHMASAYFTSVYTAVMKATDKRLSTTNEASIRIIKLFAWEPQFREKILGKREAELRQIWRRLVGLVYFTIIGFGIPAVVTLVTFGAHTWVLGRPLTAPIAFTALSLLNLLREAMEQLPDMATWALQCRVSLRRIEKYLGQPEIERPSVEDLADHGHLIEEQEAIGFVNASFRWTDNSDLAVDDVQQSRVNVGFVLNNMNISFPFGELSVVAGPTGSGKTSILMALLGEMRCTSGKVLIPRRTNGDHFFSGSIDNVAYVAQQAWLQNLSIRDNILFGREYDAKRYRQVIRACALERDLEILDAGDQTEIGEKGVTLSGGQKQRVALARAVYSSAKHLLLDDCLSAVDAHTAKHIVEKCLLGPLLQGRTRILVTHHVELCLHHASLIVVMREGKVVGQGTPVEVTAAGVLPESAISSTATSKQDDEEKPLEAQSDPEEESGVKQTERPKGQLTEEEGRVQGKVDLRIYDTYIRASGGYGFWLFIIALYVLSQAVMVLQSNWLRIWASSYEKDEETAAQSIGYYLGIYTVLGLLTMIVATGRNLITFQGSLRASRSLHQRLLDRVLNAKLRFFDVTPIGRLMNRFSKDMETIDQEVAPCLSFFLVAIVQTCGIIAVIIYVIPQFIFAGSFIAAVYILVAVFYVATSRELKRIESVSKSPLLTLFGETINGVATIRAFGMERRFFEDNTNRIDDVTRPFYLLWATNRWLSWRTDAVGAFVSFFTGFFVLLNRNAIDAALAGFALSFALGFVDIVIWVVRMYGIVEMNMNSIERISEYLTIEQEPPAFIEDNRVAENWPDAGEIKVESLVIQYTPDHDPVVRDLSFNIQPGERVGIVGRTGAGKSTLAISFFRFVEATSGRIIIDNVDISQIGLHDLRSHLTIIPQDPILFNGTIRSNLDPFNMHSNETIWNALRRSHLIGEGDERPPGLESLGAQVTENGSNFSQGQRQLLAMARALLSSNKLIIMDEATASVDFETDAKIQHTIREEFANATLLCIAHRLRTIIDYDKVLVMDAGRAVEFDSPYALIQKPSGLFRQLCERSGEFDTLVSLAAGNRSSDTSSASSPSTSTT
ncbi:P-loop containing nucleoside triphosphate hydrolase protein [Thamnocephalis sphaerospora]|uniref:P-loop containing nucleoside triphosphate hydrolase protein n=1 Tax=Thamnocephalis sphaerospora TaxID=78915 RepID=A0A4P9XTR3_9FUNG|nr:P-loop containing nucleoside triphosphate hydrolase protein [Thamnocephalis sphaerospora]|eukprot:RKP09575.1 P-loop containing nucleoside triphosphate hydrolase protein [Thamnocephalis sphaerospora]